jgi:tetratricopeptide (TPR) repeat protein
VILVQLGPVDAHVRELGDRGSRYLASAGRRALARGDMPAASTLLQRATRLRSSDDPERPGLGLLAGDALIELGEFASAETALSDAIELAMGLDDRRVEMRARLSHLRLRFTSDPDATEALVLTEVERAIPLLEGLADDEGLARAWRLLLQLNFTRGHYGAAERAADRMIEHARRAGDPTLEARFLPAIASCALYGPTPVATAEARCRELLVNARADRRTEAIGCRRIQRLSSSTRAVSSRCKMEAFGTVVDEYDSGRPGYGRPVRRAQAPAEPSDRPEVLAASG